MNKASENVMIAADNPAITPQAGRGNAVLPERAPAPRRWRILAVDDEESILSALTRVLRRAGYELSTANSAADALLLMEKQPAHLVISDHRMPGKTGIEFLREVRQRCPSRSGLS